MPDDASPERGNRSFKLRRLLAAAAILFLTWFLWQLLGPSPPIIVSKETTHITAPLLPSGLPDYRKYVEQQLRDGVTLENNAAVLMWQAIGPGRESDALRPADWQRISQEFNLPPLDESTFLVEPDSQPVADRVAQWFIENDAAWKQAFDNPPAIQDGDPLPSDVGYDLVFAAMEAPWRREELSPLAEWVDANNAAIDLLVEASNRPRFFTPFESPDPDDEEYLLTTMPFSGITAARKTARALEVRAMLHLGEGRHAAAWQDLLAMHRWARLVGQGSTVVEQLIAIAIDGIACSADAVLLGSNDLPLDVAKQIRSDLQNLPPAANLAKSFDHGERLYFLDAMIRYQEKGIGTFVADGFFSNPWLGEHAMPAWQQGFLNLVSADWNVGLAEGNRWYDRLAAAARTPNYGEREGHLLELRNELLDRDSSLHNPGTWAIASCSTGKRSEMLGSAILKSYFPTISATMDAQDRERTTLALTQLAAALAVYRAGHGEYPDRLDQLVPDIIPTLPVDLFHETSFLYKRDADGYLLYCVGPNGRDDDGSHEPYQILAGKQIYEMEDYSEELSKQIPTGADDIAIRLPRPPFKLPELPAARESEMSVE